MGVETVTGERDEQPRVARVGKAGGRGYSRWPWWVSVLAVYTASRLFAAGVFLFVASRQEATDAASAAPDYFTFVSRWYDGAWYMAIADHGYPTQLPVDGSGVVGQNAWAFYPLYPMLVHVVMAAGGRGTS